MLELDAIHDRVYDTLFAYLFDNEVLCELRILAIRLLLLFSVGFGEFLRDYVTYLRLNVNLQGLKHNLKTNVGKQTSDLKI